MNIGEVWGATDCSRQEKEEIQLTFENGVREGKRYLMKEIDAYFMDTTSPGSKLTDKEVMEVLAIDKHELDALVLGDPDHFDIDRLPVIYHNLKSWKVSIEAEKTKALFL